VHLKVLLVLLSCDFEQVSPDFTETAAEATAGTENETAKAATTMTLRITEVLPKNFCVFILFLVPFVKLMGID
jgi:hypothetical protein